MFALIIVLAVITFLTILTLIPIYIKINFKEDLCITLRYLFFKFNLLDDASKKDDKKSNEKYKKDEKKTKSQLKYIRDTLKHQGLNETIALIKEISKLALGILRHLFSHIIIDDLNINFVVVGNDAADTAIKYGYTCSAVFPALSVIMSIVNCKRRTVEINPGFNEKDSNVEFLVKFHIKPIFAISTLIVTAFKYIKWMIKTKLREGN